MAEFLGIPSVIQEKYLDELKTWKREMVDPYESEDYETLATSPYGAEVATIEAFATGYFLGRGIPLQHAKVLAGFAFDVAEDEQDRQRKQQQEEPEEYERFQKFLEGRAQEQLAMIAEGR